MSQAAQAQACVRAWVGLGANLGAARETLREALRAIAGLPGCRLAAVSSLWRSAPVDATGPDFFNAVAGLDTTLAPLELLRALQAIELAHGRERPYRNAPRTLDLDLLLHGDVQQDDPVLTLPHPRAHERAFVLAPLAELAPELPWPGRDATPARLLPLVQEQAVQRLPGDWA